MTNVKRFTIRCMEDEQHYGIEVENPEGSFVDIADYSLLLARLERIQKALKTLNSRWGVRSGECYTCDLRHGKHSSDCPIPEIKSLLAEALEEKP